MINRTKNYTAFYVTEPFNESNLGANKQKDFCYYNLLKAWKAKDSTFPFVNAHDATYSVRDGSDWEKTLKLRLHARLAVSKNIILFLSEGTISSRALREEIEYGISTKELPVIVIYPDYSEESELLNADGKSLNDEIKKLWDRDLCKIPFLPTAEIQTQVFGCFCFKYPLILLKYPLNPP